MYVPAAALLRKEPLLHCIDYNMNECGRDVALFVMLSALSNYKSSKFQVRQLQKYIWNGSLSLSLKNDNNVTRSLCYRF